jgi:hypothetical protein
MSEIEIDQIQQTQLEQQATCSSVSVVVSRRYFGRSDDPGAAIQPNPPLPNEPLAYHVGLRIVRVRQSAITPQLRAMAANFTSSPTAPGIPAGFSRLVQLEHSGLVTRVRSLSRPECAATYAPRGAMSTMMFSGPAMPTEMEDANFGAHLVEFQNEAAAEMFQTQTENDPIFESVSRVAMRYLATPIATYPSSPLPPQPGPVLWNLQKICWSAARCAPSFTEPTQIKVAVLDTGIDLNHPDFAGRSTPIDYTYSYPDSLSNDGPEDIIGHGTHVSGIITARIGNNLGIEGICDCKLCVWKIFTNQTTFANYHQGFVYYVDPFLYHRALSQCISQGIDVLNLSIGGSTPPDANEQVLYNLLLQRGTVVVAAMGNQRQYGNPISYPAAIPGVIAVGATNIDDTVAVFSNRGNHITLVAPGVSIWSTLPTYQGQTGFAAQPGSTGQPVQGAPQVRETDYAAWDGTSMATPHVTAAVAMLLAARGRLSPAEVKTALENAADKVGAMTHNQNAGIDYGAGRLNLLRLLT